MTTNILSTRNGAKGAYTFTFDDGGDGQYKHAVKALNDNNLVGTFFLIGNSVRAWYSGPTKFHVPQMLKAHEAGHEIGSHSYTHTKDLSTESDAVIKAEIGDCQSFLGSWGIKAVSLAYPYGAYSQRTIDIAAEYLHFARAVGPYKLNTLEWSDKNPFAINATSGTSDDKAAVQKAIDEGKWHISVFHTIPEAGPMTPQRFATFAAWVAKKRDANDLWVDTFGNVMQYVKQRHEAAIVETTPQANQIRVAITTPPPNDFLVPLTLKTELPYGVSLISVNQSGMQLDYKVENNSVIYNVIPNGGSTDILFTT